jgi:hypothetical protein
MTAPDPDGFASTRGQVIWLRLATSSTSIETAFFSRGEKVDGE